MESTRIVIPLEIVTVEHGVVLKLELKNDCDPRSRGRRPIGWARPCTIVSQFSTSH
jgi:hypothetical protein